MSVSPIPCRVRFGFFEADLESASLTRKGVPLRLQEQPFRILAMLLEHPGRIVTREELRQKLWPDGTYVGFDGSLNAALNRLRLVLGDDADNPRFIETIPKHGYRFIAPVSIKGLLEISEPEVRTPPAPTQLENQSLTDLQVSPAQPAHRRWVFLVSAAVLTLCILALTLRKKFPRAPAESPQAAVDIASLRRSVAVLGFQNASGRPSDAWLSTALAEMLRTELGAGGKLRVVPGENVAQFRLSSSWSQTDSLSQQTASQIGKTLDSDLLVLGSFATVGEPQDSSVRVDFRLQDARTGQILYEGSEAGGERQFFSLVAKIGAELRERLGLSMISESEEASVVSSLPSDPDASRFYSLGLEKLRDYDDAAAQDLFLQAEKLAPRFPLVHLMLFRAWSALGFDQKAKDEIKMAYDLSAGLPETDKLQIEAAYDQDLRDSAGAISAYRALYALDPDSVDYADQLINALDRAGRREEALAIVKQLRELPAPASEDPRIDFWEGQLVSESNISAAQPFIDRAAAEAASRGQKLVYAHFRLDQCINRIYGNHPQGAETYCQEAYDIFMADGNRLYAADALRTMADRHGAEGDISGARQLYLRALSILGQLGEHEKIGVVFNNLAITYENQNQIDKAEELFRKAAQTWKVSGDIVNEGYALGNLADIRLMRGQLQEAEKQYENARKQIEIMSPNGSAYELYSIATVRLYEGDIAGAKGYANRALVMAHATNALPDVAAASAILGGILLAENDLPGARQSYQQALAIRQQLGNNGGIAEEQATLAGLSIEEGRFSEAEQTLRKSLAEFRSENATLDEIQGDTDLSRALLHEDRLADARQAISDAFALSPASNDPGVKLPVAIMDARIEVAERAAQQKAKSKPDFSSAWRKLVNVRATAHSLGFYGIECDARLALAELELREKLSAGRLHLAQLSREAHERGMELISRKAANLQKSAARSSNRRGTSAQKQTAGQLEEQLSPGSFYSLLDLSLR